MPTVVCSYGDGSIGHIQADKIRWEIHSHLDPRYAFRMPRNSLNWASFTDLHGKGDGIGAEVAESVKTTFKADNVPIEWEQIDVSGVETGDKHSEELFREAIASLNRNRLGLKGTSAG